jgi:UDP-glucose 4-epimerase
LGKVLVTGGAGFIGSHLVEALVGEGHTVTVVDNLSTGHLKNLEAAMPSIEFLEGDTQDPALVEQAISGCDFVFHQAALASVPASIDNPLASHAACATGTLTVLDASRKAGVKRVVYAASSSCYGDQPTMAKRESDPLQPMSPYAAAKLSGELYCEAFYHTYGLETVGLRYFNVFGPRQDPDSPYSAVIPIFLTRMLRGSAPVVYGDGGQSRDFTFVANVVQANLRAAVTPGIAGRRFNVANGAATSLLQLIDALNEELQTSIQPRHEPARVGDIRDSMADITSARKLMGYSPDISFRQGLGLSIDYYRQLAK